MAIPHPLLDQPAPPFALTAVASRRVFRPADHRGKPVLLLFADHTTGRGTQPIVERVRRSYPDYNQLVIALVIDARIVPRLFRGAAEGMMEKEYRQTAAQLPREFDPADHLILLPDWAGEVVRAYGVSDLGRAIGVILIDAEGVVRAAYQGPHPVDEALALTKSLLGRP